MPARKNGTSFSRGADKVVPLGAQPLSSVAQFQRVSLQGRFDAAHQFLLDNRSYEGRPGYEVLTPLLRTAGDVALIDRGWVPFSGLRSRLPGSGHPVARRDHRDRSGEQASQRGTCQRPRPAAQPGLLAEGHEFSRVWIS